jgi:MtN3 and saliva related transmembrane protein
LNEIEILGFAAGTLTTFAFLPQVIQVWRTRRVADINLTTFSAFVSGVALWLVYGIVIGSPSVIASNVVTFALAMAILVGKLRFGGR